MEVNFFILFCTMNLASDKKSEFLYVGFNQDYGCFSCSTEQGFIVFDTYPLKERFRRGKYINFYFHPYFSLCTNVFIRI